ncbi:ankyrin repeat-containing protein BDA1-like [Cajanus cajan]|uniref:Ankyrin repeat-containing protein At2g01680 family n=1 Tax=Cajanus cajan TaxID=3821 RepID=A0A151RJ54_CAJCA|nr:ankyrin repeat-containing protein BDA1-like [Cajanus cajan]KYP42604.1 Ankyrin repeat-containing protein At2g01680 family [Cajanus cajan]
MASNTNTTSDNKLKTAAEDGDINLLYSVIEEDPQVLDHIDSISFVETPLHVAASFGNIGFAVEIMRLKPSFAWKLNPQGYTPMHLAMQHGHKRMVVRFVDVNKELVRVKGREGVTPLHFASQIGEVELLGNFLLACPDSIEDVSIRSETALHIAVRYQQYEALQLLVGWLKRTCQTNAIQIEKTILNWKDDAGNTILHVSALLNDSKALELLLKTKIDLKAKNLEKLTALDIATSAEIKKILVKAGAKRGSSVTDAPTLVDILKWNITLMEKIVIFILRIRRDITEDQRNALLGVAALIATATYQSVLSPPGGVFQASADNNNINTTSSNSTATEGNAGTSVLNEGDFLTLSIINSLCILVSTVTIHILTPSGIVGSILITPMFWFAYCYLYSMKVISPTNATQIVNLIMMCLFVTLHSGIQWTFSIVYKRLKHHYKKRKVETRNIDIGRNLW